MKYIIFSGTRDTGKTKSVYRLTKKLISQDNYTVISGHFPNIIKDFKCILEKGHTRILIHSYTDNHACINALDNFYSDNNNVSHIITTARDIVDPMRSRLFNVLKISDKDNLFEIPLGKVRRGPTREECIKWYLGSIEELAYKIVKSSLFNL